MNENLEFGITITYAGPTHSIVTQIASTDLRLPVEQFMGKVMWPIMTRFRNWVNYTGTTPMATSSPKHRLHGIPARVTPTIGPQSSQG